MRSRIAIFEGYGPRRRPTRRYGRYGFSPEQLPRGYGFSPRSMPQGMGGPLLANPRGPSYGGPLLANPRGPSYGRRAYVVPPTYGPTSTSTGRRLNRKGYRVRKGKNSKWQIKFKRVAKKCARQSRNKRRGAYQACMRKNLKKGRR